VQFGLGFALPFQFFGECRQTGVAQRFSIVTEPFLDVTGCFFDVANRPTEALAHPLKKRDFSSDDM